MKRENRQLISGLFAGILTCLVFLVGCSIPQVSAQERMFLDWSLEFLDAYQLPKQSFAKTPVGGLSGITYDRQRDRFYAISDDRGDFAPARFYTLKLNLNSEIPTAPRIENLEVEAVTFLTAEDGKPYPRGEINPEGIAFAAPNSLFISSEGVSDRGIPPFIHEFNRETGQFVSALPIPQSYIPDGKGSEQTVGVQDNLGFESLTINPRGFGDATVDPFRIFTATESPLQQDQDSTNPEQPVINRLLHYLISDGPPLLIGEYAYPMSQDPHWSLIHSLTELLALDPGGHLLSLERSFGFLGYKVQIFQINLGGATDTSSIPSLIGLENKVQPVQKNLLLNLEDLGITLDNLEGMTLGPRLPDGSQSLMLVSDDNFNADQVTQFLLFRLKKN